MSINIRLNKEINPQKLLSEIQEEINKHRKNNSLENSILSIEVKNISHIVDGVLNKLTSSLEKLND